MKMKQERNIHSETEKRIFGHHAEVCKTLANPKRLEILYILMNGEVPVGELVERLNLSRANVSQHLTILRQRGVVVSRRDGTNIYYRISNQKITQACKLMREFLMEQFAEGHRLFKARA